MRFSNGKSKQRVKEMSIVSRKKDGNSKKKKKKKSKGNARNQSHSKKNKEYFKLPEQHSGRESTANAGDTETRV